MIAIGMLAGSSGRVEDTPGWGGDGGTQAVCFWKASAEASWIQLAKRGRFSLLKEAN